MCLVYLTQCILGKSSVFALMRWVNQLEYPLIRRKSQIVNKSYVQMYTLAQLCNWPVPKNRLIPMNSPSLLIHWRYQAALLQYLWQPQLEVYLRMGSGFLMDLDNLASSPYQYTRERSLLAMILCKYGKNTVSYGTTTSDDEDIDQSIDKPNGTEDWEKEAMVVPRPTERRVVFRESYSEEPRTKRVKTNESPEIVHRRLITTSK